MSDTLIDPNGQYGSAAVPPATDTGPVASTSQARSAGTSHLSEGPALDEVAPPETETESTTTGALAARD